MTQHPFFLIARNPNTVDFAVRALRAGANGLEPDVVFDPTRNAYFVSHDDPTKATLTLDAYLQGLAEHLTTDASLFLRIIALDLKPKSGGWLGHDDYSALDINRIYEIVRRYTRSKDASSPLSGVLILTTVNRADGITMLCKLREQYDGEALGVDENTGPELANELFMKGRVERYTYSEGILAERDPTRYAVDIWTALRMRDEQRRFRMVYSWATNSKQQQDFYLGRETHRPIDALIVGALDGSSTAEIEALASRFHNDYGYKFTMDRETLMQWNPFVTSRA